LNQHSWQPFHRRVLELLQQQLGREMDPRVQWQPMVAAHYMLAAWHIDQRIWLHSRDNVTQTLQTSEFYLYSPSYNIIAEFMWLANLQRGNTEGHPAKHLLDYAYKTAHDDITSQDQRW
jgi:hypothetical protein